jgi:hypothetical protein
MIKSDNETRRIAVPRYNQTSLENGDIKEKSCGGSFFGVSNRMDIPRFMNGIVLSKNQKEKEKEKRNCFILNTKKKKVCSSFVLCGGKIFFSYKSTAISRSEVIVKSVMARSALSSIISFIIPFHSPVSLFNEP